MGRLDDVVARNQKASNALPGLGGEAIGLIEDVLDPRQDPAERRRKLFAVTVAVAVVGAVVVAWLVMRRPHGAAPGGKVIDRAGKRVELSDLWADRRVVIAFYRSLGCDECRAGLKELETRKLELDATIIVVSAERRSQIEQRRVELGLTLDLYADPSKAVFPAWGIPWMHTDVPMSQIFVVERGGRISYRRTCVGADACPVFADLLAVAHR